MPPGGNTKALEADHHAAARALLRFIDSNAPRHLTPPGETVAIKTVLARSDLMRWFRDGNDKPRRIPRDSRNMRGILYDIKNNCKTKVHAKELWRRGTSAVKLEYLRKVGYGMPSPSPDPERFQPSEDNRENEEEAEASSGTNEREEDDEVSPNIYGSEEENETYRPSQSPASTVINVETRRGEKTSIDSSSSRGATTSVNSTSKNKSGSASNSTTRKSVCNNRYKNKNCKGRYAPKYYNDHDLGGKLCPSCYDFKRRLQQDGILHSNPTNGRTTSPEALDFINYTDEADEPDELSNSPVLIPRRDSTIVIGTSASHETLERQNARGSFAAPPLSEEQRQESKNKRHDASSNRNSEPATQLLGELQRTSAPSLTTEFKAAKPGNSNVLNLQHMVGRLSAIGSALELVPSVEIPAYRSAAPGVCATANPPQTRPDLRYVPVSSPSLAHVTDDSKATTKRAFSAGSVENSSPTPIQEVSKKQKSAHASLAMEPNKAGQLSRKGDQAEDAVASTMRLQPTESSVITEQAVHVNTSTKPSTSARPGLALPKIPPFGLFPPQEDGFERSRPSSSRKITQKEALPAMPPAATITGLMPICEERTTPQQQSQSEHIPAAHEIIVQPATKAISEPPELILRDGIPGFYKDTRGEYVPTDLTECTGPIPQLLTLRRIELNYIFLTSAMGHIRVAMASVLTDFFEAADAKPRQDAMCFKHPTPSLHNLYTIAFGDWATVPSQLQVLFKYTKLSAYHATLSLIGAYLYSRIFNTTIDWDGQSLVPEHYRGRRKEIDQAVATQFDFDSELYRRQIFARNGEDEVLRKEMIKPFADSLAEDLCCIMDVHAAFITTNQRIKTTVKHTLLNELRELITAALGVKYQLDTADTKHEFLWYTCPQKLDRWNMDEVKKAYGDDHVVLFTILPGIRASPAEDEGGRRAADVKAIVMLYKQKDGPAQGSAPHHVSSA